ncbi:MAG: hypothetical protein WAK10_05995, partial [Methanoregula sp.]
YNQDQRTILDKALSSLNRAGMSPKKVDDKLVTGLRTATYQRKKDFGEITKLTEELEKKINQK